jgi:hypothetical protein
LRDIAFGLACLAMACHRDGDGAMNDAGRNDEMADAARAFIAPADGGEPDTGVAAGTLGVDASDAGLSASVLAVFARATPTIGDCIEVTPLPVGAAGNYVVDVAWHMEVDGHLIDVRLVHATGYCNAMVVRRHLERLKFPPQDRAYDGTYRFLLRM